VTGIGRFGIDFDRERAVSLRLVQQTGGGVDDRGGAHREKNIAISCRGRARDDGLVQRLAEPHDGGPRETAAVRTRRNVERRAR